MKDKFLLIIDAKRNDLEKCQVEATVSASAGENFCINAFVTIFKSHPDLFSIIEKAALKYTLDKIFDDEN